MAIQIREAGFDGFKSVSSFGQVHKKNLYNLNLFGYPVREGKITLISTNRVILSSLSYEYRFGPTNDTSYPIDNDKFMEIINEWFVDEHRDDVKFKDVINQLKELLIKKSKTPI
jgi:hypothetical protein